MVFPRLTKPAVVCDYRAGRLGLEVNYWNVIADKSKQQKFMPFDASLVANKQPGRLTFLAQDHFIPRQKFFLSRIDDKKARNCVICLSSFVCVFVFVCLLSVVPSCLSVRRVRVYVYTFVHSLVRVSFSFLQITFYTYNCPTDLNSRIDRFLNKLSDWQNTRSRFLDFLLGQKMGLFHHFRVGNFKGSREVQLVRLYDISTYTTVLFLACSCSEEEF